MRERDREKEREGKREREREKTTTLNITLIKGDVIFPHLLKGAHLFPRMTNNFSSTFKPGKRRGRKGEEGEQKRDRV